MLSDKVLAQPRKIRLLELMGLDLPALKHERIPQGHHLLLATVQVLYVIKKPLAGHQEPVVVDFVLAVTEV